MADLRTLFGVTAFHQDLFQKRVWVLHGKTLLRHQARVRSASRPAVERAIWAMSRDNHFSHETEDNPSPLRPHRGLRGLTARSATTIGPTIQEPISKVTALKNKVPNNSTILSSI